jgi:hypothetical protein
MEFLELLQEVLSSERGCEREEGGKAREEGSYIRRYINSPELYYLER